MTGRPASGCRVCAERRHEEWERREHELQMAELFTRERAARPAAVDEDDSSWLLLLCIGFVGFLVWLVGLNVARLREQLTKVLGDDEEEAGGEV